MMMLMLRLLMPLILPMWAMWMTSTPRTVYIAGADLAMVGRPHADA